MLVGVRVPRLEDPLIDASTHVFDERAEQAPINGAQGERGIDDEAGVWH
jgi:hypothetical protein